MKPKVLLITAMLFIASTGLSQKEKPKLHSDFYFGAYPVLRDGASLLEKADARLLLVGLPSVSESVVMLLHHVPLAWPSRRERASLREQSYTNAASDLFRTRSSAGVPERRRNRKRSPVSHINVLKYGKLYLRLAVSTQVTNDKFVRPIRKIRLRNSP